MRKVIMGIAILIQCINIGAMERRRSSTSRNTRTAELVPAGFFDAGVIRMNENIQNVTRTVSLNKRALSNGIAALSTEYRNYLNELRPKINQIHFQQLQAQQQEQETSVNKVVQEKDAEIKKKKTEIQRLRTKMNSLASASHTTVVGFDNLDAQIRDIESDLRKKREKAITADVSELFSESDFSNRADVFDMHLEDVSTSIRLSSNRVGTTLDSIQAVYNTNVNLLKLEVQSRHNEDIAKLIHQFNEEKRLLDEEYSRKIDILNDIIQRLKNENTQLERKLEFKNSVNTVLSSNPSLAGRPIIRNKAADIKAIRDFSQKKRMMEDLYDKFKAFAGLYGKRSFGIKATKMDLRKIQDWITSARSIYSLYEQCVFPQDAAPFSSREDLHNPPSWITVTTGGWGLPKGTASFSGTDIAAPLNNITNRITTGLNGLNGTHAVAARRRLNTILQNNPDINTRVTMVWLMRTWWNHATDEMEFLKNGAQQGRLFQEYGGKNWRHAEGFVGNRDSETDGGYPDGTAIWNTQFVPKYNEALQEVKNAIHQREAQLLDLETNPESELNKAYRQAKKASPTCIDFPVAALDKLINQYNEFMRM